MNAKGNVDSSLSAALASGSSIEIGPDIPDVLASAVSEAGYEITRGAHAPMVLLSARRDSLSPSVRWIHSPNMGVDGLLSDGWVEDVLLTRTVGDMPNQIAEYVEAVVLAERWKLKAYSQDQAARKWNPRKEKPASGRNAAVLGRGNVGRTVASRLSEVGWDVTLVGKDATPRQDAMREIAFSELPDHLDWDLVVVALPLTRATYELVGSEFLGRLGGTHLVNVGRGSTVDLRALQSAVDDGSIRHATLDVFAEEPLNAGHWAWGSTAVTITPHIAGVTRADDVVASLGQCWESLVQGRVPTLAVDLGRGY